MPSTSFRRLGAILIFAAALGGLAVAGYGFFVPLTGVTGSVGALGTIIACLVLALLALVLPAIRARGWRNVMRVVLFLGILSTAFAGLLLHEGWLLIAMVVALVGLLIDVVRPGYAPGRPIQRGMRA